MPDEPSTPPDSTSSPQVADMQAPPSEPVSAPSAEPPQSADAAGQATPPPEAAAPAPEPTQTETPATTEAPSSVQDYGRAQQTQTTTSTSVPALHGDIAKARAAMQNQKRKKLDKIMTKLTEKGKWFDKLTTGHERRSGKVTARVRCNRDSVSTGVGKRKQNQADRKHRDGSFL